MGARERRRPRRRSAAAGGGAGNRRYRRGSDGQRRGAAPRYRERFARQRRGRAAHRRAADRARRSLRADRSGRGGRLHRFRPARPAVRTDPYRRLRDGRHPRQSQRPDHRRRAEHRHRQRRRGHRVLRAAARHRPGVQGPDRDLRRRARQHRRRRHQLEHQGRKQRPQGDRLPREDTEVAVRQRLHRQRQQHPAGRLHLQPLRRLGGRPGAVPRLRRPAPHLLHVRLRRHPRGAAAQQRHADRPDRKDADRRLLRAARARSAVPDLQPVHPADDCRRPDSVRSLSRQHHSAEPDQSGGARRARVHRASADRRRRRRHRQLPEPVAARDDQVRDQHRPHRPQPHREAAGLRPLQLVRPEQQLQQLLRQPGDRRVVPVRLASVRVRSRLRAGFVDGGEPALRLQLFRARHRHQSRQSRLRPDVARLSRRPTTRRSPTISAGSRDSTSPGIRAPGSAASTARTPPTRSWPT